jgi:Winged helix DNA-binding domain
MTNPAAPPSVSAAHASLTAAQAGVTAERAVAQLLSGPPALRADQVAGRLLAIQGQDPRGARLAVRVRSQGLSAADIDHALTADRTLVISWLNRGTLHLVRSADYWMLHRLTTPQLETGCARRLAQEGIPPAAADRAAGLIERFLSDGPLTRAQLAGRLQSAGVRTEGQALVFLLFLTSLRGITVRGPMIGKQHAHVLARDWLGAPPAAGPDPGAALGWLARRYLAGHSPASDRDLAKWAGLPLRDARRALREIGGDLDEGEDGLVRLARRPDRSTGAAERAAGAAHGTMGGAHGTSGTGRSGRGHRDPRPELALPPPRLLGVFDPLLHGWQSRGPVLGRHEPEIVRGGMFRSFALVDGRAAGTWSVTGDQVSLTLLEPVSAAHRRALEADADDVGRFLGLARPGRT